MTDDSEYPFELITSVRLAGESTLSTFTREIARCHKEDCSLIVIPVDDLSKLVRVAEAAMEMQSDLLSGAERLDEALEELEAL